ncbi:uncharacterized protein BYT42DRAFT_493256, partial [Radiomyces spectabilis]|uniref:uncharacterized protein n=1 Tax=Radiomyces spectabilis TaxID=64574 RepID=UPI00221EC6D5
DYASSMLLSPENGIIRFLKANVQSRDPTIISAEAILLEFLISYIRKCHSILSAYLPTIINCCLFMAGSRSVRVRSGAVDVFITLLDRDASKIDLSQTDVTNIYQNFYHKFPVGTAPTTFEARILELLGVVAKYHSDVMTNSQIKTIQRWCVGTLHYQLFEARKAENSLIAGSFKCINAMLSSSKFKIEPGKWSADSKKIYRAIKEVWNMPGDLARFMAPIAALELFANHAQLFDGEMIKDSQLLLDQLQKMAHHGNRDLSKLGYRALETLFKQESVALAQHSAGNVEKQVFLAGSWLANQDTFFSVNPDQDRLIGHLPSFLQAYAQFSRQLDQIPSELLSTLTKMADRIIINYSRLSVYTRQPAIFAMQDVVMILYGKGEGMLRMFLRGFFYNALVCTCTDVYGAEQEQYHAYTDLLYFWEAILKSGTKPAADNEDTGKYEKLNTILYDEFCYALQRLIKTFNLELVKAADQEESDERAENSPFDFINAVSNALQPANAKDFILFQNLVDFWCALLPKLPEQQLHNWVHVVGGPLTELSLRHSLVSGFYRMNAVILRLANDAGYFRGCRKLYLQQQQQPNLEFSDAHINHDVYNAFVMFSDYLREVWYRLQQFKDELLASCLRLILACPMDFFDIAELVPPLQTSLSLGLSFHPLAMIAIDTLESLMDCDSPVSKHPQFLIDILPLLNDYLMMALKSKADAVNTKRKFKLSTRSTRRHEGIHRQLTAAQLGVTDTEYVSLHDIQLRIMRFVGRIGGLNKLMLQDTMDNTGTNRSSNVNRETQSAHPTLAWDPDRKLRIHIPFPNARIDMTLGNAFQAKDKREAVQSRYHRIYLRVFPILMRLAIDIDQLAREMFRTLLSQLIHWLTNNAQYENPETIALLQTCLDAACDTNAALRDYGADCLQQFVKWSIKQTSQRAVQGPMNIKSLLKRLRNLSSNPSSSKRLGAALIFNRIYRIIREEETVIDEYTFEILHDFLFSLRLAEQDHPSIGTREQIKEAISHIKRILRVKSSLFMKQTRSRRSFPGLSNADMPSLVVYIFQETGQLQREYAKTCMDFFNEFVLVLPGIKNGKQWMKKQINDDPSFLASIYGTQQLDVNALQTNMTIASYQLWLKQLHCALDGYIWLLERELVEVEWILQQESAVLLDALQFFVDTKPGEILKNEFQHSTMERWKTMSLYAYAAYRMIGLLQFIIGSSAKECEDILTSKSTQLLLKQGLFELIAKMLLLPRDFAENAQAEQGTLASWLRPKAIRKSAATLLAALSEAAPAKTMRPVCRAIGDILFAPETDLTTFIHDSSNICALGERPQLIEGILSLQSLGLLDDICKESHKKWKNASSADTYCAILFDEFLELRSLEEPMTNAFLGDLIRIAFKQPGFAGEHGRDLLGYSGVLSTQDYDEKLSIYQKFNGSINDCIASHFKDFGPLLIEKVQTDVFARDVILGMAKYLSVEKAHLHQPIQKFSKDVSQRIVFILFNDVLLT